MVMMEIIACLLIVQMVYWMNKQGKSLKANIENELTQKTQQQSVWGIFTDHRHCHCERRQRSGCFPIKPYYGSHSTNRVVFLD